MFRCKELIWPQDEGGDVHLSRQALNRPIHGQAPRPVFASAKVRFSGNKSDVFYQTLQSIWDLNKTKNPCLKYLLCNRGEENTSVTNWLPTAELFLQTCFMTARSVCKIWIGTSLGPSHSAHPMAIKSHFTCQLALCRHLNLKSTSQVPLE